jgi:hypothetical protein
MLFNRRFIVFKLKHVLSLTLNQILKATSFPSKVPSNLLACLLKTSSPQRPSVVFEEEVLWSEANSHVE